MVNKTFLLLPFLIAYSCTFQSLQTFKGSECIDINNYIILKAKIYTAAERSTSDKAIEKKSACDSCIRLHDTAYLKLVFTNFSDTTVEFYPYSYIVLVPSGSKVYQMNWLNINEISDFRKPEILNAGESFTLNFKFQVNSQFFKNGDNQVIVFYRCSTNQKLPKSYLCGKLESDVIHIKVN